MTGKLFKKAAVLAVFAAAAGCAAAFPGVDAHSSESRDAAQSLYEVIAAEIAAHREQPEVALALLDQTLARTKSSEVGELAWRTALQTRNPDIVLEQARAWAAIDPKAGLARRTILVNAVEKGRQSEYVELLSRMYADAEDKAELIVNTPQKYQGLTGVEVRTLREATHVDPAAKKVTVKNLENGQEEVYEYDKLIVATGASAVKPPIAGVNLGGVFPMRAPDDAVTMRDYLQAYGVKKAVVIGGGFIGLELAENLFDRGVSVTVVEGHPGAHRRKGHCHCGRRQSGRRPDRRRPAALWGGGAVRWHPSQHRVPFRHGH